MDIKLMNVEQLIEAMHQGKMNAYPIRYKWETSRGTFSHGATAWIARDRRTARRQFARTHPHCSISN